MVEEPIRAIGQSFAMMKSFTGSVAVGRPPLTIDSLLVHPEKRLHTFRIDVEGQEYQRLVAWVSPLVHEGKRFIDQGTRSPCVCLTVDRVGPGAGDDSIELRLTDGGASTCIRLNALCAIKYLRALPSLKTP
jgi:hypothetical protein